MERHTESVLLGFLIGMVGGLAIGIFTGPMSVFVLSGVLLGIVVGSIVDLPTLLRRAQPEDTSATTWQDEPHGPQTRDARERARY